MRGRKVEEQSEIRLCDIPTYLYPTRAQQLIKIGGNRVGFGFTCSEQLNNITLSVIPVLTELSVSASWTCLIFLLHLSQSSLATSKSIYKSTKEP